MGKKIITISREFGSGGRLVGAALAKKLDVPYYDKKILDNIAKENGFSAEMMAEDEMRAKNSFLYSLTNAFGTAGYGPDTLSINERFFMAQFDYITNIAKSGEGGVIIGRCADYVLRDFPNTVNIFITASMKYRIAQIMNKQHINAEEARKFIESKESKRAAYYNYYTGKKWGAAESYDLCIDSSILGLTDTEKIIAAFIRKRFEL